MANRLGVGMATRQSGVLLAWSPGEMPTGDIGDVPSSATTVVRGEAAHGRLGTSVVALANGHIAVGQPLADGDAGIEMGGGVVLVVI